MPSDTIRTVLVIEDHAMIASDLQRFLGGTGYHVIGPVGSTDEALHKIASGKVDGVALDVKLAGDASTHISDALKAARVPYIFVNGWALAPIPEQCRDRPLLNNPYDYCSLLAALKGAMGERPAG